MLEEKRNGG